MSRLWLVAGIMASMTPFGHSNPGEDEVKKLQGTWIITAATRDGATLNHLKGGELVFVGDRITLKPAVGEVEKGSYQIDPSKKPKAIDFEFKNVNLVGLGKAIYELDGDVLKMCAGKLDDRPTEFTDKARALTILKRKK